MTIFDRNNDSNRVQVPEIEVQGDRMNVNANGQDMPREQNQREYELPKTKWW
jgi:hypothetical protein